MTGLVGDPALDRGLEGAPGDVHGAGQGALLVLVRLTDVEDHGIAAGDLLLGLGRLDLPNGRLGRGQHLPEGRHNDHDPCFDGAVTGRDRPGPLFDICTNTTSWVNIPTGPSPAPVGAAGAGADSVRPVEATWS